MQILSKSDNGKEFSGRGRLYFKHIVEGLLRGDAASRASFYKEMLDRGVFCINEVRELEDKDPIPGGDRHFIMANMISIENAGRQPAQQPKQISLIPKDKGNGEDEGITEISHS
jgi:hypothetical protein